VREDGRIVSGKGRKERL